MTPRAGWQQVIGLLLVFALGLSLGIMGTNYYHVNRMDAEMKKGPDAMPDKVLDFFTRSLDLNDAQREKVRPILMEAHDRLDALHSPLRPQAMAIIDAADERIKTLLTPEQKKTFEDMIARRNKMFKDRQP